MTSLKRNFIYRSVWQIIVLAIPLVLSPFLSRTLGAEGIGVYSYVSSVFYYFLLAINLGIFKYGMRLVAKERGDREKLNRSVSELYRLHKLISAAGLALYTAYVVFLAEYKFYASVKIIEIFAAMFLLDWIYFGLEEFRAVFIRDVINKAVMMLLILLFLREKEDLPYYFLIMAFYGLAATILYRIGVRRFIQFQKTDLRSAFRHFRPMLLLFVPVALEYVYTYFDKIMLGRMCTMEAVGFYENAVKALIAKNLLFALSDVMLPRISNLMGAKNKDAVRNYLKKSTDINLVFSMAFAFGTAAVAKEFAPLFWGGGFAASSPLIVILSFSLPFQVLSNEIRTHILIPAELDRYYMISAFAGTVVNLVLNLLFIPRWGAAGAACSTVIAEAVVFIAQLIAVKGMFSVGKYLREAWVYVVFGLIMTVCVRWTAAAFEPSPAVLLLEVGAGAAVYALACLIYWKITDNTFFLELIKGMLHRKSRS